MLEPHGALDRGRRGGEGHPWRTAAGPAQAEPRYQSGGARGGAEGGLPLKRRGRRGVEGPWRERRGRSSRYGRLDATAGELLTPYLSNSSSSQEDPAREFGLAPVSKDGGSMRAVRPIQCCLKLAHQPSASVECRGADRCRTPRERDGEGQ